MHVSFDLLKFQLDDADNKMELYLQRKNYSHHQSLYQVHLIQKQILLQNHVLILDLQCIHHTIHVQYALQLDEHENDTNEDQQVQHKIHK